MTGRPIGPPLAPQACLPRQLSHLSNPILNANLQVWQQGIATSSIIHSPNFLP
ncbi:hypothetical protein [[Phormidium] sp. ETS-05]|uniref:hypothetical protein n=1 Tax=[Phormidium] sp. ETS-05 TaxID=222819 RepID=UPI0018EF2B8B|nr:hypothetical protein [[Phormidium] sp. ETS-05]